MDNTCFRDISCKARMTVKVVVGIVGKLKESLLIVLKCNLKEDRTDLLLRYLNLHHRSH